MFRWRVGKWTSTFGGHFGGFRRVFTDVRFQDLSIDKRLLRGIEAAVGAGARLTPVQHQAFSQLQRAGEEPCEKRPDLLLQAHTGTGKTIAFLLPALQRLLAEEARKKGLRRAEGVSVLVLAPTRELVLQLAKVASRLLQYSGGLVRSSFVVGGFSVQEDIERLKADAPHILFATPWRLVHHLQSTPHFVRALGSVQSLVLDEADRLLNPVFVHKVDYIFRRLPCSRPQMILCSATFNEHIQKFAVRSLRANLEVISTTAEDVHAETHPVQTKTKVEVAKPVDQVLIRYDPHKFLPVLHALLVKEMLAAEGEAKRVLVIFPTVRWLQFFYVLLKHRANMPGLLSLHRSLSADRRRNRAVQFSKGAPATSGALFATDVAARGMDFDVHSVIQVGCPEDREQYVHRAGRTGRLESTGRSFLLLNPLEEITLKELDGLHLHREEHIEEDTTFAEAATNIHGWWEDASISASAHLFYASAISFYLHDIGRLRANAGEIVRTVSALIQSAGLPKDYGLPALPKGLAAKLRQKDELVAVRTETVRERWDVLAALSPHPKPRMSGDDSDRDDREDDADDDLAEEKHGKT